MYLTRLCGGNYSQSQQTTQHFLPQSVCSRETHLCFRPTVTKEPPQAPRMQHSSNATTISSCIIAENNSADFYSEPFQRISLHRTGCIVLSDSATQTRLKNQTQLKSHSDKQGQLILRSGDTSLNVRELTNANWYYNITAMQHNLCTLSPELRVQLASQLAQ